jgi:hypothetical protein
MLCGGVRAVTVLCYPHRPRGFSWMEIIAVIMQCKLHDRYCCMKYVVFAAYWHSCAFLAIFIISRSMTAWKVIWNSSVIETVRFATEGRTSSPKTRNMPDYKSYLFVYNNIVQPEWTEILNLTGVVRITQSWSVFVQPLLWWKSNKYCE